MSGLEKQEFKAILLELTQEIKKLREAIAPPPGVPAMMRVQEYYKIVAKKRIDVYVEKGKTDPYKILHVEDPKIIIVTAYGDDVQVDFDAEVTEDSMWVLNKQTRWWSTEGISKVYAKSRTTDLTAFPNGLYVEVWG